jgi:predicted nucleotidyltransferase
VDDARIRVIRSRLGDIGRLRREIRLLVLFGSAVRGRSHRQSDVDVAVLAAGPADLDAVFLILAPIFETSRLDLVDLEHAGPLLAFEVARFGQPLYETSPGLFREFQSLAFRRYADTKKLRDAQKRSIEVFLARERHA